MVKPLYPGGGGAGSGEPLAVRIWKPGGFGAGSGEPLKVAANVLKPGGGGAGRGEPLTIKPLYPGGFGAVSGEPLAVKTWKPGGLGAGRGEPLPRTTETPTTRLLDKCLTELLAGSTIKTAKASHARRIEMFFFMVKSLLTETMKENREY